MPKKVSLPITERYPLDKLDPSGETYVTVRQAHQDQQEKHDNLYAETTRIWNDQAGAKMQLMQRVSVGEVIRTEAFLTMVDCNILGPDDLPLFKFDANGLAMDNAKFTTAWGTLDPSWVEEIHEKIRKMNPVWGPEGKAG